MCRSYILQILSGTSVCKLQSLTVDMRYKYVFCRNSNRLQDRLHSASLCNEGLHLQNTSVRDQTKGLNNTRPIRAITEKFYLLNTIVHGSRQNAHSTSMTTKFSYIHTMTKSEPHSQRLCNNSMIFNFFYIYDWIFNW